MRERSFGVCRTAPELEIHIPLASEVLPYLLPISFIAVFFFFQVVSIESILTSVPRQFRIST